MSLARMISGAHVLLYSKDAEADRLFFRDVLGFPAVDAGGGWLICALPPAEVAVHPVEVEVEVEVVRHAGHRLVGAALYLMCGDLRATIAALGSQGVSCTEVEVEPWGIRTTILLPSGAELGLYQPTHASPLVL